MKPESNASRMLRYIYLKKIPVGFEELKKAGFESRHINKALRHLVNYGTLNLKTINGEKFYLIPWYKLEYVKNKLEKMYENATDMD